MRECNGLRDGGDRGTACTRLGRLDVSDADLVAASWGDLNELGDEVGVPAVFHAKFYGFIDSYWEKVAKTPSGIDDSGETVYASNPHEFDVLHLNVRV